MRLNRYLAAAGFGSRRACEDFISAGKVSINGHFVTALATSVQPDDDVRVGGKVAHVAMSVTIALHKPRGFLSTRSDELGRKTIFQLVPPHFGRLFHVGRLDMDSEGLMLLTNDGELSQRLAHPSHTIEKEYEVLLDKPFNNADAPKLIKGIMIEGGRGRFVRLHIIGPKAVKVVLKQGIKRQIREMFFRTGYEVKRLMRIRIGGLHLGPLRTGDWKQLSQRELDLLETPAPSAKKPVMKTPVAQHRELGGKQRRPARRNSN